MHMLICADVVHLEVTANDRVDKTDHSATGGTGGGPGQSGHVHVVPRAAIEINRMNMLIRTDVVDLDVGPVHRVQQTGQSAARCSINSSRSGRKVFVHPGGSVRRVELMNALIHTDVIDFDIWTVNRIHHAGKTGSGRDAGTSGGGDKIRFNPGWTASVIDLVHMLVRADVVGRDMVVDRVQQSTHPAAGSHTAKGSCGRRHIVVRPRGAIEVRLMHMLVRADVIHLGIRTVQRIDVAGYRSAKQRRAPGHQTVDIQIPTAR